MRIIHRGHELSQQQLDAIVPVLNESMRGKHPGKKRLEAALDKALEAAGCPVPAESVTRQPTEDSGDE